MIWKPIAYGPSPTTQQTADRVLADWLSRSADGFGLPLVGALLGFEPPQEAEFDLLALHDSPRTQG